MLLEGDLVLQDCEKSRTKISAKKNLDLLRKI